MEVIRVLEIYKDKLTQYWQETKQNPKNKGFNDMIKEQLKEEKATAQRSVAFL